MLESRRVAQRAAWRRAAANHAGTAGIRPSTQTSDASTVRNVVSAEYAHPNGPASHNAVSARTLPPNRTPKSMPARLISTATPSPNRAVSHNATVTNRKPAAVPTPSYVHDVVHISGDPVAFPHGRDLELLHLMVPQRTELALLRFADPPSPERPRVRGHQHRGMCDETPQ